MQGNPENKLQAGVNSVDANTGNQDYQMDWFPLFLRLQITTAFFEYILTEAENDRQ